MEGGMKGTKMGAALCVEQGGRCMKRMNRKWNNGSGARRGKSEFLGQAAGSESDD